MEFIQNLQAIFESFFRAVHFFISFASLKLIFYRHIITLETTVLKFLARLRYQYYHYYYSLFQIVTRGIEGYLTSYFLYRCGRAPAVGAHSLTLVTSAAVPELCICTLYNKTTLLTFL